MSRYINAEALKEKYTMVIKRYSGGIMERPAVLLETIDEAPSIDLADYVPKDFHDKTCEAMAKAHQEEIANILERADADRPQGHYVKGENGEWYCSNCKRIDDKYSVARYCWWCGARMKGADDE